MQVGQRMSDVIGKLACDWPAAVDALIFAGLMRTRNDGEAALRQAQTQQLLGQVPARSVLSIITAMCVVLALRHDVAPGPLVTWLVVVGIFNLYRRQRALALLANQDEFHAVSDQSWRTIVMATSGALLFSVPSLLWFATVGFEGKLIICILVTGMVSGACISLSGVPAAAFAFVAIMGGAMIANFYAMGMNMLVAMTILFVSGLFSTTLASARRFVGAVKVEFELAEKSQLVELLRAFDASGSSWVWEIDRNFRVAAMSSEMAQMLGETAQSIIGRTAREVLDPSGRGSTMSASFRMLAKHGVSKTEFRDLSLPVLDGRRWWSLSGQPLIGANGAVVGWRGVGSDITDSRLTGSDSIATARRDPLTKLANRLLIREMVEEALIRNAAGGPTCVLLLIDLDRFKQVNDTLGHAVGDQLLCQVAARLKLATHGVAQVGRLGGDEFAVLLPSGSGTRNLSGFCRDLIEKLSNGYKVGDAHLVIGASIGVACGPVDGADDQALIRSADLALYRAKGSGRGVHVFYEPEMLAEAQENRLLESDVRSALVDGQLSLVYQPIVDAVTREVVGREALLRWNHPERGSISPDLFIPIIEDLGLIGQIGSWVIHQACAEAIHWPDRQRVAVNISVAQLTGASLSMTVVAALGATGLDPDRLELEVTETIFMGDDAGTIRSLSSLRALGVRLVLDDFGKGYFSFGYLSRATFAKIKIDRMFVRAAAAGCRQSRAIVGSILALARGLDLETTAEGIETADEARLMSVIGCSQLQGFYFGHPAPVDHGPVARLPIAGGRGRHDRRIVRFG